MVRSNSRRGTHNSCAMKATSVRHTKLKASATEAPASATDRLLLRDATQQHLDNLLDEFVVDRASGQFAHVKRRGQQFCRQFCMSSGFDFAALCSAFDHYPR